MPQILKPPKYHEGLAGPLIFLAGPIRGAERWQDEAIHIIQKLDSGIAVANPRRDIIEEDFNDTMFYEQVDWETHYLNWAAENGVILFWLAREREHECTRAYAQTTRWEIAEWKERHRA